MTSSVMNGITHFFKYARLRIEFIDLLHHLSITEYMVKTYFTTSVKYTFLVVPLIFNMSYLHNGYLCTE